jgi:hypothetical protein
MSRGRGRIEQVVEALFTSKPSETFSTDELVEAVYRGVNRIEKKHRVAVLRAADKVANRLHWQRWQCERWGISGGVAGRGSIYVNMLDVHSYALGRLRVDNFNAGLSIAQLEAELHKDIWAKRIKRGGTYWLFVEQHKAKAGLIKLDRETKRMVRAQKKQHESLVASIRSVSPEEASERERRQRRREANQHACLCGRCGKAIEAKEPVARITVKTYGGFFGRAGPSLEVQCLDCANKDYSFAWGGNQWEPTRCAFCGREVYDRWRRHRRRSFCCEGCRRKWKARMRSHRGNEIQQEEAKAMTTTNGLGEVSDYFGSCPVCHKNDGYLNVGRTHWFYCKEHKKRWCAGSNLFSSWHDQTEEQQRKMYDQIGMGEFETVEPFHE